jgi:hypothetical protein
LPLTAAHAMIHPVIRKWHLFNIAYDIGENTDLASEHPEILEKLMQAYDKFSKDVGVIVPRGIASEAFESIAEGPG